MNAQLPTRRHWFRRIGIGIGCLLTTLVLALGCGFGWLWSWTWKGAPDFHESWTAEERAALTAFDASLRTPLSESLELLTEPTYTATHIFHELSNVIETRNMCADIRKQLHHLQ